MKQIASLDVKAGGGKAQLRFIFAGGLEAAGCFLVAQLDACAMLQMPGYRRRVLTGVDLSSPVNTLRALFGNTSDNQCGEGWPKVATLEPRR